MGTKPSFRDDREADILSIDRRPPYAEQMSEEVGDEVMARLKPETGEVENLKVHLLSARQLRPDLLDLLLPIWGF